MLPQPQGPNSGLAKLLQLQGQQAVPGSVLTYVPSNTFQQQASLQGMSVNPRNSLPVVGRYAKGGEINQQAQNVAKEGRYGDTTLVHMNPQEVRGLASLGQLTVNPSTGLPEAFKLKQILPAVAGIAASVFLPGLAPAIFSGIGGGALAGGLGTFAGSLLAGNKMDTALQSGITAGLTGYAMGNLFSAGADPTGGKGLSSGLEMTGGGGPVGDFGSTVTGASDLATAGQLQAAKDLGYYSQNFTPGDVSFSSGEGFTTAPSWIQRNLMGMDPVSVPANQAMSAADAYNITGGQAGYLSPAEALEKPSTYAKALGPLAAMDMSEEYQEPEKKPTTITPQEMYVAEEGAGAPTQQTALDIALRGGAERQGPRYGYRNLPSYVVAKSGGLISLAEGGMPKVIEGGEIKYTPTTQSALKDALIGPSQQMIEPYRMRDKESGEMSSDEQKALFYRKLQETDNPMLQLLGKLSQQFPDRFNSQSASPQQNGQIGSGFNVGANVGNTKGYAEGGVVEEQGEYFEGPVEGSGDGMSDEVEFEVEGENPDMAMLSRDEYVLPADVVAILGNGSSEAGADKLDMFIKQTRKKAFGTEKQQKEMKGDGGLTSLVA